MLAALTVLGRPGFGASPLPARFTSWGMWLLVGVLAVGALRAVPAGRVQRLRRPRLIGGRDAARSVVLVFVLRVLGAGFGWIVDLTVLGPRGRTLATLVWQVGSPPEQGHPNRSAVVGVSQEDLHRERHTSGRVRSEGCPVGPVR